ncbi:hypothetical protein AALP_AAs41397U000100 [Arabis alpina]|uniref:Uncharacterized protein n=1 Tax=Arabis alpina TaxID=50452 RepID=A0A087G129_ARAAL|nr:hypothetical protein AALP_AAs41397U000100 [Arabis alpina]
MEALARRTQKARVANTRKSLFAIWLYEQPWDGFETAEGEEDGTVPGLGDLGGGDEVEEW